MADYPLAAQTIKNEFRAWVAKYPKKLAITPKDIEDYLKKEDH